MRNPAVTRGAILASLLVLLPQAAPAQDCVCLRCVFGGYQAYWEATTSMLPTLAPGDCFTARLTEAEHFVPAPGDIVVVRHATHGFEYVKRVVAIGGQTVQMIDGVLTVDDVAAELEPLPDLAILPEELGNFCLGQTDAEGRCLLPQLRETLENGVSYVIVDIRPDGSLDNTPVRQVPDGHVFLLGDNRDNSLDSRVASFGTVPLTDIVGVVEDIGS